MEGLKGATPGRGRDGGLECKWEGECWVLGERIEAKVG